MSVLPLYINHSQAVGLQLHYVYSINGLIWYMGWPNVAWVNFNMLAQHTGLYVELDKAKSADSRTSVLSECIIL